MAKSTFHIVDASQVDDLLARKPRKIEHLRLASPYITSYGLDRLKPHLKKAELVHVLVKLDPWDWACGASDARAFKFLLDESRRLKERFEVHILENLHAKLVLLGNEGIVGSSNLTKGGLVRNHELGVKLTGAALAQVEDQFDDWFASSAWRKFTGEDYDRTLERAQRFPPPPPDGSLREIAGQYQALRACVAGCHEPAEWKKVKRRLGEPKRPSRDAFLEFLVAWEILQREGDNHLVSTNRGRRIAADERLMVQMLIKKDEGIARLMSQLAVELKEGLTYKRINEHLPMSEGRSSYWEMRVRWLRSLKVLDRVAGVRPYVFKLTQVGEEFTKLS